MYMYMVLYLAFHHNAMMLLPFVPDLVLLYLLYVHIHRVVVSPTFPWLTYIYV